MTEDILELSRKAGSLLKQRNLKLVTIESCTGGSLAKLITDIPGASNWFECGFTTYSNESKTKLVNVPAELIAAQGAVSQKVALAMAKGGLATTTGDIAISTTGIAGPDGGTPEKPVGTVCFGFAAKDGTFSTDKQHFSGDRFAVRAQSIAHCLKCLCNYLETDHF